MLVKHCPDCQSQEFIWIWIMPFINTPGDCSITSQNWQCHLCWLFQNTGTGVSTWTVETQRNWNTEKKRLFLGDPRAVQCILEKALSVLDLCTQRFRLLLKHHSSVQFVLKLKVIILLQNNWTATASDSGAVLHTAAWSLTQLSCPWVKNGMAYIVTGGHLISPLINKFWWWHKWSLAYAHLDFPHPYFSQEYYFPTVQILSRCLFHSI